MPTLGENPSETPILDSLLTGFKVRVVIMLSLHIPEVEREIERIKKNLASKAERGLLTKEDIERALQDVTQIGFANYENVVQARQKSILAYLALNYEKVFREVTGCMRP